MKRGPQPGLLIPTLILCILMIASASAASHMTSSECRAALDLPGSFNDPRIQSNPVASAAFCLPWRADLWEKAAHQSLLTGDPSFAVLLLQRLRKEAGRFSPASPDPLTLQGLTDLAEAAQKTGDLSLALQTWDTITAAAGLNLDSAAKIASLNWARGDVAAAAEIWGKLAQLEPANSQARFEYGRHLATQNPEAGLIELEKAASLDSQLEPRISALRQAIMSSRLVGDPSYSLLNLGRAFAAAEDWPFAAEAFRLSIIKRPDYAEAWAFLGEARQHLPLPDPPLANQTTGRSAGLFELQTAVELDPKSISAQTLLALYWMRQSRSDLALDAIHAAVAQSPENPALIAERARLEAASGDLDAAYQSFKQAARMAPLDPEYPRQLIRFSIDYNYKLQQIALPEVRRLVVDEPNNVINLDLMAQVLISQGDLDNAERFVTRLLQVDPNSASAYLHLGLIYLLRGERNSAQSYLQHASALDPGGVIGLHAQRLLTSPSP